MVKAVELPSGPLRGKKRSRRALGRCRGARVRARHGASLLLLAHSDVCGCDGDQRPPRSGAGSGPVPHPGSLRQLTVWPAGPLRRPGDFFFFFNRKDHLGTPGASSVKLFPTMLPGFPVSPVHPPPSSLKTVAGIHGVCTPICFTTSSRHPPEEMSWLLFLFYKCRN